MTFFFVTVTIVMFYYQYVMRVHLIRSGVFFLGFLWFFCLFLAFFTRIRVRFKKKIIFILR
jgi:Na+/melibiose symporter-like transporter